MNENSENKENKSFQIQDENNNKIINWTHQHEKILIELSDKAMCYKWLHNKAYAVFSNLNAWYTIPVIIISTVTGTANFAQERLPLQYQSYFSMGIGVFSIVAGIITTIQQFLKITQLSEGHRVSTIAWDKFYRNIKIELIKHPSERMNVKNMLKLCKDEYDRLIETSPDIPEKIIKDFKNTFKKTDEYIKILKPDICDSLISTSENINDWYNEDKKLKIYNDKIKEDLLKDNIEKNNKIIIDFIKKFYKINNRKPLDYEIIDNLKDILDLDILTKIISENRYLLNNDNDLEIKNEDLDLFDII